MLFGNNDFIILVPSIQNDSWWFDLLKEHIEKVKNMLVEDVVLIKINQSYKENMTAKELYEATSISWVASFKKTKKRDLKFYCAVVQNKIIEVYKFLGFEEEVPVRTPARFILHGEVQIENIREQLVGLDVSTIHKGSGNPIKYTNLETLLQLKENPTLPTVDLITHIQTYIKSKGFNYSDANIKNLYLSLRSKPFVIISGISGTGKTKIVQLFAESIGATEQNGQFMLIPVRPDWSDGSELLGYTDIANNFKEGPLTKLLIHAKDHPERPHFLLLDEMNLARVEYYFSDILSVMESRALTADGYTSSKLGETATGDSLWFPGNLYIIGTVNMDETTHPFSKKVLDRANTLQFNDIDLLNFDFLKESSNEEIEPVQLDNASLEAGYIQISHIYPQHEQLIEEVSKQLEEINAILKSIHAQVGYRVRDEICFYLAHNEDAEMLLRKNEALDFCYMQKILPRIAGSGERVEKVLTNLAQLLTKDAFPLCAAKIKEMQGRLGYDEFTAFW